MKEIVKTSRLAGQLEKLFNLINADWFNGELETPVITVVPSSRAYGHYTPWDSWMVKGEGKREINISSAQLYRPIEATVATLMHEMCHMYNDTVLQVQDTSNKGVYHNKCFKETAEAHGLIVSRSEKYGWSHTEPADCLIEWLCDHDEFREIELCRVDPALSLVGIGTHAANGGAPAIGTSKSNSRRYHCPACNAIIRATRAVNVICGDCLQAMIEG